MTYIVKKIRELSGVTVRTLHYYEEEGLLKPRHLFLEEMRDKLYIEKYLSRRKTNFNFKKRVQ